MRRLLVWFENYVGGNLPAQEQHGKNLKFYPSQPDQLDSHCDTQ